MKGKFMTKNLKDIKWNSDIPTLGVYILYDRSGSMASRQEEAVSSVNSYVKELSNAVVTLVAFDTNNPKQVVRDHVPVENFTNLNVWEVSARGGTPLYDATGWIIDQIYKDNPKRAVLILQSDGEENSSKEYNNASILKRISDFKERGYQVVFLGSDFKDVGKVAQSYGMNWATQINRTAGNYGAVSASLASKTMAYAASGSAVNWTEAEKKKLGDNQ